MSRVEISYADTSVVVLGAGSGIGSATATLLARRGATVMCLDRDPDAAGRTASQIASEGGIATALLADVTDRASLDSAFEQAREAVGQIHGVVNSVGVQGELGVRSHEASLEIFDGVYAVNLRGALAVSQVALSHMLEFGYGRIAHVASIAGKEGNPNMIAYSTTKAGLIGMVKAQGKEYAKDGITINAIAPAVIQTPFLDTQPADVISYMTEKIPMGRTGRPSEVAEMVAWMVSPECSFTTGFTFDLSGGRATY
jgi:NAD(P)-dependent dehydrogenase (short-subunit alcohol dehydrogenase family)